MALSRSLSACRAFPSVSSILSRRMSLRTKLVIRSGQPQPLYGSVQHCYLPRGMLLKELPSLNSNSCAQSTPALVLKRSGTPFQNFDLQSRMQFPIQKILLCDWADLAVIVLATADCHRYMEYYKWDATLTTPEPGTSLYGLGLQADRSSVIDQSVKHRQLETTMAAAKHIITCKVVGQEKGRFVKNFDPECHFLTDYGDLSREFRPHGFSGCGWWRYKDQESLIWTASPIFSGVEFAYASSGNLLINVRPEKVTAFLEEAGARIR